MKSSKIFLEKLNNLLIMNYEIERVYLESLDLATDDSLKAFFKERSFEQNEFNRQLTAEIIKFDGKPKQYEGLSNAFERIWKKFKNFLLMNNRNDLMEEVYYLIKLSKEKNNMMLMEFNLPLSTCKLLLKHHDSINRNMNAIARQEEFAV